MLTGEKLREWMVKDGITIGRMLRLCDETRSGRKPQGKVFNLKRKGRNPCSNRWT